MGGLDEGLGLAVGLGAVRPGSAMADSQSLTGSAELEAIEAGSIVGQHLPGCGCRSAGSNPWPGARSRSTKLLFRSDTLR